MEPIAQRACRARAKRRGLVAFGLAGCLSLLFAQTASAGELVTDEVASVALGRPIRFTAYLPDGYRKAPGKYPVVYLLHGAGGDEHDWPRHGRAVQTLDGLIERGVVRPVVAIMPTTGPASWWADGAAEKAETAFMTELLPYVESRYKVSGERSGRGIAGLSMGGYGALNLSLGHPDKFCAAGLISPAVYDPLPPDASAARTAPQFMRNGRFDADTWKALNYPARLGRYAQQPQKVPMWIVSGDHDFLGIAVLSANLYRRLLTLQPGLAELRIVDGDHDWMTFRSALPQALQYVDRQCAKAP